MENVFVSKNWIKYVREKSGEMMFASGILKKIEDELQVEVQEKIDVIIEELKEIMQLTRRKIVTTNEIDYVLDKLAVDK